MARIFGAILILLAVPCAAAGQQAGGQAGGGGASEESTHVVVVGETLWELAYRYYGDPFHWPTIFEANRVEIEDPHWIYPDERFRIPGAPNQPPRPMPSPGESFGQGAATVDGLSLSTGAGLTDVAGPARRTRPSLATHVPDYRTVFFDTAPLAHGSVFSAGRRDWLVVPRDVYYSSEWLSLSADATPRIGYVRAFQSIVDEQHQRLSAKNFDRLQISLPEGSGVSVGDQLVAYRADRHVFGMGTVIHPTGRMIVSRLEDGGAIAVVTAEFDRIQLGDMVDVLPPFDLVAGTYPRDVLSDVQGEIVGFGNEQELYGHGDIAFISIGADAGLRMGDELEVRPPDDRAGWPADAVGRVQVLRVQEYISSVRIIGIENHVFVEGARVRLVRKMPA